MVGKILKHPNAILALFSYRMIKVLCDYRDNISFDEIMFVLHSIDDINPIDIRSIRSHMVISADIVMEFAYAAVCKLPMEDFTVKEFKFFLCVMS